MRIASHAGLMVLAIAFAGCGSDDPTGPDRASQLVVFSDPVSSVMTSDVRDVNEQIVRFDAADQTLIWAADGSRFAGWPVSGNFLDAQRMLQVRFGTRNGERRAYFTETASGTICDIEVVNGRLSVTGTSVPVP